MNEYLAFSFQFPSKTPGTIVFFFVRYYPIKTKNHNLFVNFFIKDCQYLASMSSCPREYNPEFCGKKNQSFPKQITNEILFFRKYLFQLEVYIIFSKIHGVKNIKLISHENFFFSERLRLKRYLKYFLTAKGIIIQET